MKYSVRYVHKIAPKPNEMGNEVEINGFPVLPATVVHIDAKERNAIARILRSSKNMLRGQRLMGARVEPDGRIVCFPADSIWHSIILTPEVSS